MIEGEPGHQTRVRCGFWDAKVVRGFKGFLERIPGDEARSSHLTEAAVPDLCADGSACSAEVLIDTSQNYPDLNVVCAGGTEAACDDCHMRIGHKLVSVFAKVACEIDAPQPLAPIAEQTAA